MNMKKSKPLNSQATMAALLILAALALPGCITADLMADEDIHTNGHGDERYPIVYQKGPTNLEVATTSATLSNFEKNHIRSFLTFMRQNHVRDVVVKTPSGGGNSAAIAGQIAKLLVDEGVRPEYIAHAVYAGDAKSPVKIEVTAEFAGVEKCGDWSKDMSDTAENTAYPNFGCAVQSNLAVMINDPKTLAIPKTVTPRLSETDVGAAIRADTFVSTVDSQSIQTYKSAP